MSETTNTPIVLMIRDGWGHNPHAAHVSFNAIAQSETPVNDQLTASYPHTLIATSSEDVGLSKDVMGNSEVGHQNIGAGRIVDQEIMRINRTIDDGSFFQNQALTGAFEHAEETAGSVHLMGLVSDGRVHSDIQHLFALIDMASKRDWPSERLFVHVFTDGRDTGPHTGLDFVRQVWKKLDESGVGAIASVMGRFYAMDRDNRWDRIEQAYRCLTARIDRRADSAEQAVQEYYDNPSDAGRVGDEFIVATQIKTNNDVGAGRISSGDAVIFFNFRGDRPRQLTRAFVFDAEQFSTIEGGGFERGEKIEKLYFCTMSAYEQGLPVTAVAFPKPAKMANILGRVISDANLTQFRCAETEKFAHVTFFFNDYREQPFEGEHREIVPSPRDIKTYDQKPEMSAPQVCEAVLKRLRADDCEAMIVVNFANGDMVGHTGKLDATIKAVEAVDQCVGRIVEATLKRRGSLIITADHGNAEQMWNPQTDSPHTAHTTCDVPLILVSEAFKEHQLRAGGRLADIAPTLLEMMGIQRPKEMTGRPLLQRTNTTPTMSQSDLGCS